MPAQRTGAHDDIGPPGRATRAARLLTEALSPGILVAALLLTVAWHASASTAQAITTGLIAAAAASFLPMYYILLGVRRRRWSDKHVTDHSQRRWPLLIILLSTAGGVVALAAAGAPRQLLALIVSMVAALLIAVPVTVVLRWGISLHALVAAGTATALIVVFGPAFAAGLPLAAAVGWARVRLGEHTTAQVLAGAAAGAAATGLLFPLLAG
ncbi:phosphoesterase PA-phosphatase [Actinoplanes sp. NPDC020271]|uniref:phosphoesterase PA-phosphatase n=1 Tax=Actinoplanes sp. NPDC020271 TaxID=3363896 RepID=UPI0037B42692